MCINRIIIHSKGDESVGLFSSTWAIDGPINIDQDDIVDFKQKIEDAWEFIADDAQVAFELHGECPECGKIGEIIQPPDPYEGWCIKCAYNDVTADSSAYDYRTEQIQASGW